MPFLSLTTQPCLFLPFAPCHLPNIKAALMTSFLIRTILIFSFSLSEMKILLISTAYTEKIPNTWHFGPFIRRKKKKKVFEKAIVMVTRLKQTLQDPSFAESHWLQPLRCMTFNFQHQKYDLDQDLSYCWVPICLRFPFKGFLRGACGKSWLEQLIELFLNKARSVHSSKVWNI